MVDTQEPGNGPVAGASLLDIFEDAAASGAWIDFASDAGRVPFEDLWKRSERAAAWMAERFEPGETVALVLSARPDAVCALLGAWRAGLTVASLPDPARTTLTEYRRFLQRVAVDVRPRLLLTAAPTAAELNDCELPVEVAPYGDAFAAALPRQRDVAGAFVQFTSGSTRDPAGVKLSLSAVAHNLRSIVDRVQPHDGADETVVCSWLPLSHDMGLFGGLLAPLVAAADGRGQIGMCIVDTADFTRRPSVWLKTCARVGAAITMSNMAGLEIASRIARTAKGLDLRCLHTCLVGAEPLRPAVFDDFLRAYEPFGLAHSVLRPSYGLAENTVAVSIPTFGAPVRLRQFPPDDAVSTVEPQGVVSCGPPVSGTEVQIVGGTIGEISIRGASLFSGYTGRRQQRSHEGWHLTGDVGAFVDGELYPMGRIDDMIVTRGFNLFPTDVEELVMRAAPCTRRVAAVTDGAGGYALVLELSSAGLFADIAPVVRTACVQQLSVAPARIVSVRRGELSFTASGKLRRVEVARRLAQGALDIVGELG